MKKLIVFSLVVGCFLVGTSGRILARPNFVPSGGGFSQPTPPPPPNPNPSPPTFDKFRINNQYKDNDNSLNWQTYRNNFFGFEIKYKPDDKVFEHESTYMDAYLAKFYIPSSGDILIFKNNSNSTNIEQLQAFIASWYGQKEWSKELSENFPLPKAEVEELLINTQPAIKVDYVEVGEDPRYSSPASLLFTLDNEYIYRLSCCCNRQDCNQFLSKFQFIPRSNNNVFVYPYDPFKVKLKIAEVTILTSTVGKQVEGEFTIENIGPTFKCAAGGQFPSYEISIFDKNNKLLYHDYNLLVITEALKTGDKSKWRWLTNEKNYSEFNVSPFIIPLDGQYKVELKLFKNREGEIFDAFSTVFNAY